jgi:hypothetical protein
MKIFFLPFFLLTGFSSAFAQTGCAIKKAYAWYNVSMPGNIMTDENGNHIQPSPNITRFIYVEYSGTKLPEIKAVLYNGVSLGFSIVRVKEKTLSVGDKELNPDNIITAKKGNSFLQINLQPFEGKTMPETDCKNIIIKNKFAGKLCKFYVTSEKVFATHPRY